MVLPNFLVIGAQKAATSWISQMLSQHPDVFMYTAKEVHFFDVHYGQGTEWYARHFLGRDSESAIGEKTPQYLAHPEVAQRILDTLGPEVRLIALLRHPVDRAYSAYWHGMRRGRIPPETDFRNAFRTVGRLKNESNYGAHLQRYNEYFGCDNIHAMIFEEVMRDRAGSLERCFGFLGVDSRFQPREQERRVNAAENVTPFMSGIHRVRRILRRLPRPVKGPIRALAGGAVSLLPTKRSYSDLDPGLRNDLYEEFRQDVEVLERWLGREVEVWNPSS